MKEGRVGERGVSPTFDWEDSLGVLLCGVTSGKGQNLPGRSLAISVNVSTVLAVDRSYNQGEKGVVFGRGVWKAAKATT